MSKQNFLEFKGKITELLPNTMFRVKLENDREILAHTAGRLKKNRIRMTYVKLLLLCMVARDGIEPPTQAFSGLCSTN